jgi:hypothetical protein
MSKSIFFIHQDGECRVFTLITFDDISYRAKPNYNRAEGMAAASINNNTRANNKDESAGNPGQIAEAFYPSAKHVALPAGNNDAASTKKTIVH